MYAITDTSFRAITNTSYLQPGESAVDVLPASLLTTMQGIEMRARRDAMLASCDWTQGADSPLSAEEKSAWATYRQALRDMPALAGFPDTIHWPTQP